VQTMLTVLTQIAREEPAIAASTPGVPNAGLESAVAPALTRSRKMARPKQFPERKANVRPRPGLGFQPNRTTVSAVRRHRNSMTGALSRILGAQTRVARSCRYGR
jgi:hypothetical protein